MKSLILGDTTNRSNWGCRATSAALHRMASERSDLLGAIDFNRPSLSPFMKDGESHNGFLARVVGKVPGSDLLLNIGGPITAQSRTSIRRVRKSSIERFSDIIGRGKAYPELTKALNDTDWLLINGEGAIIQNRPYGRVCFLIAYAAKTRLGKKCAIVNHTADTRHPELREMAEFVYPVVDVAVFREKFSYELNKDLCATDRAILGADAAFTYEPASREHLIPVASRPGYYSIFPDRADFDLTRPYICVGGSAHYLAEKFSWNNVRRAFAKLAQKLLRRAQVVFTAASYPDDVILRPVAKELGLPYVNLNISTHQALDILGHASLYVGGRWHPAILSLTGGVPILLFSSNTDFKSKGVLDLFSLEQPRWSALDFEDEIDSIVSRADELLSAGDSIRRSIRSRAAELSTLSYRNVDFL